MSGTFSSHAYQPHVCCFDILIFHSADEFPGEIKGGENLTPTWKDIYDIYDMLKWIQMVEMRYDLFMI